MKVFLTVPEAAGELGVSDDLVYKLLSEGTLPCVTFRRRKLVPRQAIDAVLERAMADFDPARVAAPQSRADADGLADPTGHGPPILSVAAASSSGSTRLRRSS